MTASRIDQDAAARSIIREELDRSLVVEAGAGTGKTHSLVDRIEALLVNGKASINEIVAITFTRAAASELRERVRGRLEARARDAGTTASSRARLEAALNGIDTAAIQTIDSFALALIRERSLQAGVPPLIEPMDEIEAGLAFEERWRTWLDERLDAGDLDEPLAHAVRLGFGDVLSHLLEVARAFHGHYPLIKGRSFAHAGAVERSAAPALVRSEGEVSRLLSFADESAAPELATSLVYLAGLIRRIKELGPESEASLHLIAEAPRLKTSRGRQDAWGKLPDGVPVVKRAKELLSGLQGEIDSELKQARARAVAPLLEAVAGFVLAYAEERRRGGTPEFQDLLVWASELVGIDHVRAEFQKRFRFILIDEFQDTDPLQTELALRLASDAGGRVRPGALFVVGDPKQSIYRFRHADLSALRKVRWQVGGDPVYLTKTRRTHDGVVDWINALFGDWMGREERASQPAFVDLVAERKRVDVPGPALGVHFFGGPVKGRVGEARQHEVRRIVDVALGVAAGEWRVMCRDGRGESDATRKSKPGDLCILVPTRTSLSELERGLEDAGVPYVLEGQSLVFNTQEVRDLVACLNAIDDPSNEVAIVAALRSPAFGCSDPDLHRWVSQGGRFEYLKLPSEEGPVGAGLKSLRAFHDQRLVLSVAHLVEKFIRARRLREVALDGSRPRERWRLLQAVIEQARALARAGRPSLRDLVEWAIERRARSERTTGGAASDVDLDAVRIMTIHYAKGLEFPIVLLSALNAGAPKKSSRVVFARNPDGTAGPIAVRAQTGFEFGDFEAVAEDERAAEASEGVRVLYVASTRAQDHLIVSLYRPEAMRENAASEIARRMPPGSPLWSELKVGAGSALPGRSDQEAEQRSGATEESWSRWQEERRARLSRASRRATVTATSLSDLVDRDDAEPGPMTVATASVRMRGGTSIGRAVHAVLQRLDFDDPAAAGPLAREVAVLEGIPDLTSEIERLAVAVARDEIVKRSATRRAWREVYVSGTLEMDGASVILEGFIDLIYELEDGSLCIVDYKTDAVGKGQSLHAAAERHLLQMGAYAAAVRRSTGRTVAEAWVVFARRAADGQESAYRIPAIDELAVAAVRAAMKLTAPAAE